MAVSADVDVGVCGRVYVFVFVCGLCVGVYVSVCVLYT